MAAYAVAADLAARWRTLSTAESARADVLLGSASRLMREKAPGLDQRVTDGLIEADTLTDIACVMVWRVMASGMPGAKSATNTVGEVSTSGSFVAPLGSLYLTADELLRLWPALGGAFSVSIATPDAATVEVTESV